MTDAANLEIVVDASDIDNFDRKADHAAGTAEKLENATKKVTSASSELASTYRAASSSVSDMADAIGREERALQAEYQAQVRSNQAHREAASGTREHMAAIVGMNPVLNRAMLGLSGTAGQTQALGNQARLTSYQLTNLSFQLNDVVTGLASGQKPMQILAQQGGQVFQALQQGPGGVGGSLKALLGLINPVSVGITALAGTMAVWATAAYQSVKANDDLEVSTYGLGRATGLTGAQLGALADSTANAAGVSERAAERMMSAYIRMGVTGSQTLVDLTTVTRDYAKVTDQKLKEAQAELGGMLADPIRGVNQLAEAVGGVDGQTKEYVTTLVRQGDLQQAQAVLLGIIAKQTKGAADETNGLSAALHGAAVNMGNFWKAAGDFWSAKPQNISGRFGYDPAANARAEAEAARQRAAAEAELNRVTLLGGAARDALNPKLAQTKKLQDDIVVVQKIMAAGDVALAKAGMTRAQAQEAVAAGQKKINDLSKTDEQKAVESAAKSAARSAATRAENNARELESMKANAAGQLALARAYLESGAAALKSEAMRKADTTAIKRQGDVSAFTAAQLSLDIATAAASGAKAARSDFDRAAALDRVNQAQAEGLMTQSQAAAALDLELALLPVRTAMIHADADARKVLQQVIDDVTKSQEQLNTAELEAAAIASTRQSRQRIGDLDLEVSLLGASNAERAREIAQRQTLAQLSSQKGFDASNPDVQKAVAAAGALAEAQSNAKAAADAYNGSLDNTLEMLQLVDQQARETGDGLAEAFGRPGRALGTLMTTLTGYSARQEALRRKNVEDLKAVTVSQAASDREKLLSASRMAEINANYVEEGRQAQVQAYGDMLTAAKGFFKEGTAGYQIMGAAEKAYRAIEFAGSIKAMGQKALELAAFITGEGVKQTAASATAIVSAMAGWPFPLNIAAGAATLAAIVGIGAAVSGSLGGGGGVVDRSVNRQATQGTGSVLGDATAQSQSIANALELVAANTNDSLEYENDMLRSLRSIDTQIGALTTALAKSFSAGGMLDSTGLGLGTTRSGPSLLSKIFNPLSAILPGLFGSKTTTQLTDAGVQFGGGSLADILAGGLSGNTYQDIASTTKKKFLGITTSNKTTNSTITGSLDDDFTQQATLLLGSLRDGVLAAATVIGIDGAKATLDQMEIALGTMSFKDMDTGQIQEALEAIFSKVADDMSTTVLGDVSKFQQAGEGAFETLTRLAKEYQVVDVALKSVGMTFGAVGVKSLEARDRLIQLAGGIDDFQEAVDYFAQNFLTEAERLAPITASVTARMAELGYASVDTKDEFKQLVLGLDTSTEAGANLFTALMAVAPAFATMADYAKKMADEMLEAAKKDAELAAQAVEDAEGRLRDAYDRERTEREREIETLTRATDALRKYRQELETGPAAGLSPEEQYKATKAEFQRISALALSGDANAMSSVQGVSQEFLEASRSYYASSEDYFRDLNNVKSTLDQVIGAGEKQIDVAQQQLNQLQLLVSGFININTSVLSVRDAINELIAAQKNKQVADNKVAALVGSSAGGGSPAYNAMATGLTATDAEIQQVITALGLTAGGPTGMDPKSYANMLINSFRDGQLALDSGTGQALAGLFGGPDVNPHDSVASGGFNSNNTNKSEEYMAAQQKVWDAINFGDGATYAAAVAAFEQVATKVSDAVDANTRALARLNS